jgi:hypothetical protein
MRPFSSNANRQFFATTSLVILCSMSCNNSSSRFSYVVLYVGSLCELNSRLLLASSPGVSSNGDPVRFDSDCVFKGSKKGSNKVSLRGNWQTLIFRGLTDGLKICQLLLDWDSQVELS